jgi:hypothetical protein
MVGNPEGDSVCVGAVDSGSQRHVSEQKKPAVHVLSSCAIPESHSSGKSTIPSPQLGSTASTAVLARQVPSSKEAVIVLLELDDHVTIPEVLQIEGDITCTTRITITKTNTSSPTCRCYCCCYVGCF